MTDTGRSRPSETDPCPPSATSRAPARRSRVADALRPLARRPYRLMWTGSTTSALGDAVVQIALIFAILHIGGTASDIGIVLAVMTASRVAFLLAGGVWADRLRRQYVMLTADGVRGVVQAALAALLLSGHAHLWELAAGGALYGAAASFFDPASTALVPETVPAEQLQQANSLLSLPGSFFSVSAPAAAGVLIAAFGPGWLFAADAASFFVSLACLALLRVPPRPVPAPRPFLADLAEGWHELAIRPWYWINLLAHACGNFVVPALFVLGPVIAARSLGGAPAWGALSAAWGAGAVAGGIVGLRVKPRRPLVATDLLMAGIALPLLALALSRSVVLIAVAEAVFGFTMIVGNSVWFTAMQVLIPDQVRARVGAYDWFVSLVIMPVGWLVMGPLSSSIGFTPTLVGAAALGSIPCVVVALVPRVRAVQRTPGRSSLTRDRQAGRMRNPGSTHPGVDVVGRTGAGQTDLVKTTGSRERLARAYATVTAEVFDGADLSSVCLDRVYLDRCSLVAADLRQATLDRCNFRFCDLRRVRLRGASLRFAKLTGCDLREADMRDCDLTGASFGFVNTGAPNGLSVLTGAIMDGAVLTGTMFDRVVGWPLR